jgi:nitrite reductase/ring-hydroxylating ferredoxin subunit
MGEYVSVGSSASVGESDMAAFDANGVQVGVARVGGRLFAFSDICTHRQCTLVAGDDLDGTEITCECHGSMFSIETGEVLNGPATEPIVTYPVREEDGQIQVEV